MVAGGVMHRLVEGGSREGAGHGVRVCWCARIKAIARNRGC